jgi:hypothetical protein
LKKQSQFVLGLNGATPSVKRYYDKILFFGAQKNKANQSHLKAWIGFGPESLNVPVVVPGGRL